MLIQFFLLRVKINYDEIVNVESIKLLSQLVLKIRQHSLIESKNVGIFLPHGTLVMSCSSERPNTPSWVNGHLP